MNVNDRSSLTQTLKMGLEQKICNPVSLLGWPGQIRSADEWVNPNMENYSQKLKKWGSGQVTAGW